MMRFVAFAVTVLLAAPSAAQTPQFFGPTAYLSDADIPAGLYASGSPTALEDFEDCVLDFGITGSNGTPLSPPGGGCPQQSANVDSVDGDDGTIDGSGSAGNSWFGSQTLDFTFSSPVTAAGLVYTDGAGPIRFQAYDAGSTLLGEIGPVTLDLPGAGNTADDHFFGVRYEGGIAFIRIILGGAVEVDHVQYGNGFVPVPAAGTAVRLLLVVLLGAAGIAAWRKSSRGAA